MANKLTTLDAGFLHAEDADPHTNLGIGGLAILDGPLPDFESLTSTLGERIAACPRFAQRLRRQIFDLRAPEWIDDGNFDLAHHLRRVAVPAPGTDDDLFRLVADVMSWRLDRNRPLWEIWVIEGLSDNRWAMLMKVHPCIADGVATVHILTGLSDNGLVEGTGGNVHQHQAHGNPAGEPVTRAASGRLDWGGLLRSPVEIAAGTMAVAGQALRGSYEVAASLLRPVSALVGPTTTRRRYSAARVALGDVRQICRTFDVSIDDVALAALTESYRNMLLHRGDQPQPDSLRTLVPERDAALLPYLPVDEDNPVLRLRKVHARLAETRTGAAQRDMGDVVAAAARMLPFPITSWASNLLARLPQRSVMALVANVPGPSQPLQVMGCNVTAVLPIPPIAMQLRTGAAVLRYGDELFFGILADFSAGSSADELARGAQAAVARLLACSKRRRAARDRHGLSLVISA
ncbi:MAG: wax ester/triacylglycerol synthase family O-acyltransferase [Mycobacterium sp.]